MRAYGPTVLRVFLGVVFVMHAYLALVIYTPAGAAAFNAKLGVPLPAVAAWFTILAHGLGGIMLIIGLWTRWAALANAVVMLGALDLRPPQPGLLHQGPARGRQAPGGGLRVRADARGRRRSRRRCWAAARSPSSATERGRPARQAGTRRPAASRAQLRCRAMARMKSGASLATWLSSPTRIASSAERCSGQELRTGAAGGERLAVLERLLDEQHRRRARPRALRRSAGHPARYTASKSTEPTVRRLMSTFTAPPRAPLSVPSRGAITLGTAPAAVSSRLIVATARLVHAVGGEDGDLARLGGVLHGVGHAERRRRSRAGALARRG